MTDTGIHPHDIRLYRRAVALGAKQLAAIDARVAGDTNRWRQLLFTDRNRRLKHTLVKILRIKQRRVGDGALRELFADLKIIEADENTWHAVGKEAIDYVQIVLHGLQMGVADENGRLLDDVA